MKLFVLRLIFSIAFILLLPPPAHAGFFSFISNIFAGSAEAALEKTDNSQTMALLKAPLNPDVNYSTGGGEIVIVDGNALAPETGFVEGESVSHGKATNNSISIY